MDGRYVTGHQSSVDCWRLPVLSCGRPQTAAAARQIGLKSHLILRTSEVRFKCLLDDNDGGYHHHHPPGLGLVLFSFLPPADVAVAAFAGRC